MKRALILGQFKDYEYWQIPCILNVKNKYYTHENCDSGC